VEFYAEFYETLASLASNFATVTVGNISHHIFKMDALCCIIKYRGLVKAKACRALYRNTS